MSGRFRRWSAIAAACLTGLVSCARKDQPAQKPVARADTTWPNIVLISIDTLRRDHLGCYGYRRSTSPRIDGFAAEGALFEDFISSSSWTLPAHAAMFTGLADSVHGAVETHLRLPDERYTLAERLRDIGYATAGFFAGPTLHPAYGLGQGFDLYVDCTSYPDLSAEDAETPGIEMGGPLQRASMQDVTGPRVLQAVRDWLRRGPKRPFLVFIHLWDVHPDFIPPPPFERMFDPDYTGSVSGRDFLFDDSINPKMPRRDLEHLIALYDGEIAWTDQHVGGILDELELRGLRDSTIVMLLADHGEEFFEHDQKGHRHSLFDELIRVPLIVRHPGRIPAALRIRQQARMIDILPTLLDLAGAPPPGDIMGQSLQPLLAGGSEGEESLAVSELCSLGRQMRSFRRSDRKMIRDEKAGGTVFFNLRADPTETRPIGDATNPIVQIMLKEASEAIRWLDAFKSRFPARTAPPQLPDKVRRQLESLGYVGTKETEKGDEQRDDPAVIPQEREPAP